MYIQHAYKKWEKLNPIMPEAFIGLNFVFVHLLAAYFCLTSEPVLCFLVPLFCMFCTVELIIYQHYYSCTFWFVGAAHDKIVHPIAYFCSALAHVSPHGQHPLFYFCSIWHPLWQHKAGRFLCRLVSPPFNSFLTCINFFVETNRIYLRKLCNFSLWICVFPYVCPRPPCQHTSSVDMNHATNGSRLEEFCLYVFYLQADYYGMSIMSLVVFRIGKSYRGKKPWMKICSKPYNTTCC